MSIFTSALIVEAESWKAGAIVQESHPAFLTPRLRLLLSFLPELILAEEQVICHCVSTCKKPAERIESENVKMRVLYRRDAPS
jgi:hypothetical protein